jgi:hypothetical protein
MSIKENLVKVKKHPRNYKYYNKFKEDGNYYIVPVSSLSLGSKVRVTRICDECGDELERPYKDVLRYRKGEKDYCWRCGNNTAEALRNKSDSHKGFKWSEESRLKASKTHTGMKHSDEIKSKIRESVLETTNSDEWKEWIRKYNYDNLSLNSYIKKYGIVEGEKLYRLERKSKNPFSLEYWIIKNGGNVDKAKEELSSFQRRDENYFISKYGEDEGRQRYQGWNFKKVYNNDNKYSKSSQLFISEVYLRIK